MGERQILEQELSESTGATGAAAGGEDGPPSVSKPSRAVVTDVKDAEFLASPPGTAFAVTEQTQLTSPTERPEEVWEEPAPAEEGETTEKGGPGGEVEDPPAAVVNDDLELADEGPPSRGVDKALLMASFQRKSQQLAPLPPVVVAAAAAAATAANDDE